MYANCASEKPAHYSYKHELPPPLDFGSFVNKLTMCVALTNCGALIKHYLNFKAIYALGHHQPRVGIAEMRGRTEAKRALSKLEKGYFVCYAGLSNQVWSIFLLFDIF